jgi:hypothetical protein
MDLSKFLDTLSPVILYFGGDIVNGSLCGGSPLDKRLYLHSHQDIVMVDLLENFLNPLKLYLTVARNFTKSPRKRMEGVQRER